MKIHAMALAMACLCVGCGTAERRLPYYDSADFTPRWDISDASDVHRIRPFGLLDQDGQAFTEHDLDGKIAVVDFFFTSCPGICPKTAVSMRRLQDVFLHDDRVLLISHSVAPETDTPAVLRQYAAEHGANPARWKLLTGDRAEIYDLGRRSYFVDEDLGASRSETDFLHTENFVLLDAQRRIRGIYNGLDPDSMRSLTADIQLLAPRMPD